MQFGCNKWLRGLHEPLCCLQGGDSLPPQCIVKAEKTRGGLENDALEPCARMRNSSFIEAGTRRENVAPSSILFASTRFTRPAPETVKKIETNFRSADIWTQTWVSLKRLLFPVQRTEGVVLEDRGGDSSFGLIRGRWR